MSIIFALVILLSALSISAFAFRDEFDVNDLTWEEIMTMDSEEFSHVLANFERVYDPFGTYETSPIMPENEKKNSGQRIQPYWTSGDTKKDKETGEEVYVGGSHEMITARACGVLMNDKGFWGETETGSIIIALILSLASVQPDKEDRGLLFVGHFYSPATQANYAGGTDNTARTNAEWHYIEAGKCNLDSEEFIMQVGCLIHYVQDVAVPHHSRNMIALPLIKTPHSEFEKKVNDDIDNYIYSINTVNSAEYSSGLRTDIGNIVHNTAIISSEQAEKVNNIYNQSQWDAVANITVSLAVEQTAIVLYKLSIELGIPLNK